MQPRRLLRLTATDAEVQVWIDWLVKDALLKPDQLKPSDIYTTPITPPLLATPVLFQYLIGDYVDAVDDSTSTRQAHADIFRNE
jgi:hypothetical protein